MLSHVAAFQTAFDLRLQLAGKLVRLPLGWHMAQGTGKQFHLMGAGTEKIQSFIAHKLPDMVASVVYPVTMVALMLSIDWRFGVAMAIGIAIAYVFHYLSMGRGGAKHMMDLYYNALDEMENAAVECVRGVTVLKAFGRRVGAFQKL
jgi:ATP-binding cassette subfamily B protein